MSNPNEFKYLVEEVRVFHRNLQKDNTERRRDEGVTGSKFKKLEKFRDLCRGLVEQFNKCKVDDKVKNEIRSYAKSIEQYFREIDEHLKSRIGEFHKSITLSSKIKVIIRPCSDSQTETGNMTEKFNLRTAASLLPVMDVDTGASVSIIFKQYVNKSEVIDRSEKDRITGISGSTTSEGKAYITLQANDTKLCHPFLLMEAFDNDMHEVLGSDFFHKHNAIIDYEKFLFTFWKNNSKIPPAMHSKHMLYTSMSPRCEAIKFVHVETSDDCVVLPSELCEGVFVAGCLARPDENNMIPVKILNIRDEEVLLKNFNPQIGKIEDYELCQFNDNKTNSLNRVDHLSKLINTNHLNSEEN
ncbi:hypothetical protein JTB14_002558 [Gonioctena quinquepunctata]|nr:hypothetical protein JTB14_002558 [Gonioctena quinquepunctata]